ncbi:MAG: GNAT family N-acetyltransferase [Brevundimonas sp.]|uniref:GNAT family N-acetyltransferase n=1 Tax=Brevundimonas sp. TaxID=1871086 RepID=UPI00248A0404|nr:GNAT family N-acetyltransferase [Brevundimonas sp.]MDI1328549.1 GNAT family N-acetyltransferase [Brevundimonas sp.]
MGGLIIRPLEAGDHVRWLPLWEGYNAFYGRTGVSALPGEVTQTTWARFMDPAEPVQALVAQHGDELLGLAHYLYHRSTTAIGPTCYMQDLFTADAARGKGVGRALIERVYEDAKAAGAGRVYWQTHETNRTAMLLYDAVAKRSEFLIYSKRL